MKRLLVVDVVEEVVKLEDINRDKIYAFVSPQSGIIYKAHKLNIVGIGQKEWAFISLHDSRNYHKDSCATLEMLLEPLAGLVLEFDEQEEFLEWALTEVRGEEEVPACSNRECSHYDLDFNDNCVAYANIKECHKRED